MNADGSSQIFSLLMILLVSLNWLLYEFSRAVITKYHRVGGLNNRNLFFHSSGGWKSKAKLSTGLIFSKAPLLGLQVAVFSLCRQVLGVSLCVQISSSYKDISHIVLGPP